MLDPGRRRQALSRCVGAGGCREYWPWGERNRRDNGRAGWASGVRAHFTVSFGGGGEAGCPAAGARAREFSDRWARLFHVRRLGGDRDGDQAGAAVSPREGENLAVSGDFAAAELPREHGGSDVSQRQRRAARAVGAVASRLGTYRAELF